MIESWIDKLAAVWAFALDDFTTVQSIAIIEGAHYPKTINAAGKFPIALTMPTGLSPQYTASGTRLSWRGETQIYVTPNVDNSAMPSLPRWYGKILTAAAANITLDGTVTNFYIPDEPDAISLAVLQYNDEDAPHWGFVIRWFVTELAAVSVS